MHDAVNLMGTLVWVVVIGAFVAHQFWAARARNRQAANQCIRCGRELVADDPGATRRTCASCVAYGRRGYRAASWFFYGLAVLFAAMAPFIVVTDYRRFGLSTAATDAALIVGVGAITAGAGFAIRYFGAKEL
jgi:hypothetical protein